MKPNIQSILERDPLATNLLLTLFKPIEWCTLALVCQRFNRLSRTDSLWMLAVIREFTDEPQPLLVKGELFSFKKPRFETNQQIYQRIYGIYRQCARYQTELKTAPEKSIAMIPELYARIIENRFNKYSQYFAILFANLDVNAPISRKHDSNLLCLAASYGSFHFITVLLELKADVNTYNRWAKTHNVVRGKCFNRDSPVQRAAEKGQADSLRLLVEKKADVNFGSANNWTALHRAASKGDAECVSILLKAGARTDLRTRVNPQSALDVADRKYCYGLILSKMLQRKEKSLDPYSTSPGTRPS